MKVVLLEDISSLGKKGDIKEVSFGYANNFLLPNKKAILASNQNVNKIQQGKQKIIKQEQTKINAQQKIIKTLNKQGLQFKGKASEKGNLFQAIHQADIIREIKDKFNLDVEEKWFDNFTALKDLGKHQVNLQLPNKEKINIFITILEE
ncbi:50S ribosomal protein L9 [Candidatus Nomurabacteria bacterium]|nr:50S ribosomal protein L9 [Candidatus Nomurabacteria bacterium]